MSEPVLKLVLFCLFIFLNFGYGKSPSSDRSKTGCFCIYVEEHSRKLNCGYIFCLCCFCSQTLATSQHQRNHRLLRRNHFSLDLQIMPAIWSRPLSSSICARKVSSVESCCPSHSISRLSACSLAQKLAFMDSDDTKCHLATVLLIGYCLAAPTDCAPKSFCSGLGKVSGVW